jgi:hypothetical protein
VFVYSDAEEQNVPYGELLLLTCMTLRMFSLGREKLTKDAMLAVFNEGDEGLAQALPQMLQSYADYHNQSFPQIRYGADGSTRKGFMMIVPFSEGRHATRLKPRGFGLLGKNIEAGAYMAVMLLHNHLSNKYSKDKQMLDDMNDALIDCSETLSANGGKLSARQEFDFAESITNKYRRLN